MLSNDGPYCTDSGRKADIASSQLRAHKPTSHLPFSSYQRLRNFAGFVDEKLRDGAERAVLQGHNSNRHAGVLQLDGQDLDPWTLGKPQYRDRCDRKKAPSRREIEPHSGETS